ncbi:MAG TPA: M56 family metallopeptidase [Terracidiphilus sp.]|jgi:uncharacterized protein (TIGR03435 family)|nr:M56 family metallopeptidase [Terracidiphilus sp.]
MNLPAFWNENLTAALVNHLWQSTLVVGIAWLLALALSKNHARTRYWVWMAASIKFLVPFSLLITAGGWLRSLIPAPAARPAIAAAMEQVTQPFTQTEFLGAAETPVAAHNGHLLPIVLLAIWACGALIVIFRFGRGWLRVYAVKHAAKPLELDADVPAFSSRSLIEPGIFGILSPVLLLPEGILQKLTAEQLRAIVAHEVCHVRRRDNLTYAIHMLVEALFWFHPAVWWIGARLIEERERACDEAVVQAGCEAQVYAEGILSVCKFYVESPLACVSGVTGSDLKRRIVRIMSEVPARKLSLCGKLLVAAIGAVAAAAPLTAGLIGAARISAQLLHANGPLPSFEVASIRPAGSSPFRPPNFALNIDDTSIPPGGRFFADFPLETYVEFAYKIMPTRQQQDAMVSGLAEWVRKDSFVIQAEAAGNPTKDQMRLMMQSLLADRFKLAVHFETRTVPVLALVLARRGKLGATLKPHTEGLPCDAKWTAPPDRSSPTVPPGGFMPTCGALGVIPGRNHTFLIGARDITMQHISDYMPSWQDFGRPVVDRTGLSGTYDFSLESVPERLTPMNSGADAQLDTEGPPFFEALKEQLGLVLKPENASIRVLVIDHVEQPSPN